MKHLSAILAIGILLSIALACSDSGEKPSISDAPGPKNTSAASKSDSAGGGITVEEVTLKNAEDETVTSFKPSDRKHSVSVKLSETGAGKVRGVFTAVNAGGEKNFKVLEKEVELGTLMNTATISAVLPQDFPAGDYKFDFYVGDKLVKTHNYKVQ